MILFPHRSKTGDEGSWAHIFWLLGLTIAVASVRAYFPITTQTTTYMVILKKINNNNNNNNN